jgi:pimeloyl-ACP methyl ester carboxylesterase
MMEPRALVHEVKGDGEPVVLIPGGLTGWVSWIPHAERLSARWRTIRVQPIHNELGSAGQPGVPGYTVETERESLRMTLDALGTETAHFAGWSAGGKALIEFALAYPQRIRTLTLMEPEAYWILEQLGAPDPDVERTDAFMHSLFGKDVTEDDLAAFLEIAGLATSKEEARSDPYWERAVPHRMTLSWLSPVLEPSARSIEELVNIRCPVLLVKGTVTTAGDKRVVDALGERLPQATVLELPGDHASHIQSIDAFLEAFEKHLAALKSQEEGTFHGS